jgi:hypothetical protein
VRNQPVVVRIQVLHLAGVVHHDVVDAHHVPAGVLAAPNPKQSEVVPDAFRARDNQQLLALEFVYEVLRIVPLGNPEELETF